MNTKSVSEYIVKWLDDYSSRSKTNGFVVGVSGGIDSAVTSSLAARTGRPTLCLEMPIHQDPSQVNRAHEHIHQLSKNYANVASQTISLTSVFESFVSSLPSPTPQSNRLLALANSRARLRMTTLYYFAGLHGYLVVGTGNKVEDFGVGFFTKYGDGGVDLSPIADLVKTEVFELGRELGVNDAIMQAKPTDGLWGDERSDEDQIGATYPELEWAMDFVANEDSSDNLSHRQAEVLQIYKRLHNANKHKMEAIPICLIPPELK